MNRIVSCKLYQASEHKDKINAAMTNPINSKLMTQIAEYLDEVILTPKAEEPESDTQPKEVIEPTKPTPSKVTHISHTEPTELEPTVPDTEPIVEPITEPEYDPEDNPDSATAVVNTPISASTECAPLQDVVNEIKGLLNMLDTTAGVTRVGTKQDNTELWIYYNDSVNLNNIMVGVIESLTTTDYNYLEFNRLSRTDNAIVFEVHLQDTVTDIDTQE